MKPGLRRHLTVATAAAVAGSIALGSLAVFVFTRRQLVSQLDATLAALANEAETRADPFAGGFEVVFDTGRLSGERGIAQFVPAEGSAGRAFGELPMPDDFDLLEDDPLIPIDERARAVAAGSASSYYADEEVRGIPMRVFTRGVAPGVALQVAQPLDEINDALARIALVLGAVVVAGAAGAALLGRAIAGSAVRRVGQLTDVAEEVTETRDFGRRLDVSGTDELARLGSAFNAMLDALEASIGSQKQLVSDASHELRTPLTSIRTNVELLGRPDLPEDQRAPVLGAVTLQLEELGRLVTNIVELAREGDHPPVVDEVRVDEVAAAVVRRARKLMPHAEVTLSAEPWTVHGDASRLERALANLVDNALKHGRDDRPVEVVVQPGRVVVRDHGPGISAADLPFLFDRFYRAPAARGRPGSGLGLAIVRDVAESHGGTATAANAADGGAVFTFTVSPAAWRNRPGVTEPSL